MVNVAPKIRDLETLSRQLHAWLFQRMPELQSLCLGNLTYPSGAGMSHETILFDADEVRPDRRNTRGYVVRIKPGAHTVFPDDLFEQQYRLMSVLHGLGDVRVAEPLWFESDPTILGTPFFVMQKALGRVAVSVPPYAQFGWVAEATPEQRRKIWQNGVAQLAAIQRTPVSAVGFLRGRPGVSEGLAQEWDKYTRFVEWISQRHRWPALDAAVAKLGRGRDGLGAAFTRWRAS